MSSRPLLWKGYEGMRKLLLTNIGMLATPQGRAAKKGPEQGAIQMLKNAWVLVEDGVIAQVGTGAAPEVEDAKVVDAEGNLVILQLTLNFALHSFGIDFSLYDYFGLDRGTEFQFMPILQQKIIDLILYLILFSISRH